MIINKEMAQRLYNRNIYLRPGLALLGQGFVGLRCDFRASVSDSAPSYFAVLDCSNLGSYTVANPARFTNSSIGNYCSIADGTRIVRHHAMERITTSICTVDVPVSAEVFANFKGKRPYINSYHTLIGHDVWIGSNVLIKDGLTIGHGAIIGANSMVTHNIPPFAVVAGSPAKIIKMRFPDEDIERILKTNWYTYDWNNIEVDWGDLHNCLSMMEEHIATQDVPLLGQGYMYQNQSGLSLKLEPTLWTFEKQMQSIYKVSSIQELFELPAIKNNLVH